LLPALAFGQQLAEATQGQLTVVHVLISTAIAGVLQVGGICVERAATIHSKPSKLLRIMRVKLGIPGSPALYDSLPGALYRLPTPLNLCAQAVIGGQPLLIVGVAEPIVIIYSFL
jgi:hypothetical protein